MCKSGRRAALVAVAQVVVWGVLGGCSQSEHGSRERGEQVAAVAQPVLTNYVPPPEPDFAAAFAAGVVNSRASSGDLVGTLEGTSNVTPDGAFSYTIPIRVPAGPAGMQPELSLTYNSRGGDGSIGPGWQLTGLSRITRCRKTLAGDEKVTGVQHTSVDSFCLDGVKLMGTAGTYGAPNAEYRSERADYAKIVSYGSFLGGPEYFKVWGKDGRIREYRPQGSFDQEDLDTDGEVESTREVTHAYYLVSEVDRSGNTISYSYAARPRGDETHASEPRITRIDYANEARAVVFDYDAIPNYYISRFDDGVDVGTRDQLNSIQIYAPYPSAIAIAWRYNLRYEESPSTERTRLKSVEWCDEAGACLRSTEFSWESTEEPDDPAAAASPAPQFTRVWQSGTLDLDANRGWTRPILADFNGDGRDDLVYHVRHPNDRRVDRCGSDDWYNSLAYARLSNGIGANGQLVFSDPVDVSHVFQKNRPSVFEPFKSAAVDVNVDGRADLVAITLRHIDDLSEARVFQWNASQNTFVNATPTTPFFTQVWDYGIDVGDANGDGRPDIFAHGFNTTDPFVGRHYWAVRLGTGAFQLAPARRLDWVACAGGDTIFDLSLDGRFEVGHTCYEAEPRPDQPSPTYGLDAAGNPETGALKLGNLVHQLFADVNGDGLQDAIQATNDLRVRVRLNTGRGFEPPYLATDFHFSDALTELTEYRERFRVGDFNGDGRDDLLFLNADDVGEAECGASTTAEPELFLSDGRLLRRVHNAFPSMPLRWKSIGYPPAGFIRRGWAGTSIGDIDGNGIPELVQLEGEDWDNLRFGVYALQYQTSTGTRRSFKSPEEHIVRIKNGFQEIEQVSYANLSTPPDQVEPPGPFYTPGSSCAWPQQCLKRGLTVVRTHAKSNGRKALDSENWRRWIYSYEDARSDIAGRGFLGFKCVTVLDEQRGSVTKTCHDNVSRLNKACPGWYYPYAGLPKTVETRAPLGDGSGRVRVTHTDYTWYPTRWMTNAVFAIELDRKTVRVKEGLPTSTDLLNAASVLPESAVQRRTETKFTFDWMGNLVEELETRTAQGKTTIARVKTEFDNYTDSRWLIGLPRYHEVERQRTGEAAQKRQTTINHNASTGLLESVIAEPNGGSDHYYKQTFIRGERGLVERIEEEAIGQSPRVTRLRYDGVHVRRIENAEGHVSWIGFHPALDVPMISVDPNGVLTTQRYDGFGRLRYVDEPHSGDTSIEYGGAALAADYGVSPAVQAVYFVRQQRGGGKDELSAHDTLGRTLDTYFRAFDGTTARISTAHDILGRESYRSLVYPDSGAPEGHYTFLYDRLDRPTRTLNPDLTQVTRSYPNFFESWTEDEVGRKSYVKADVDGLVEKRVTLEGARELGTTYTYWPFGNLHTATDARNNTIITEYDARGRRTRLIDPDAGVRKYFYTGFGDLREEWHGAKPADNDNFRYKDAYVYDRLGRLLHKQSTCTNPSVCRTDGLRRFDWDSRPYGVGSLASVTAVDDSVTIQFSYDELGRPSVEARTIGGALFTTVTEYDQYSRVARIQYPVIPGPGARFEVEHDYNEFGYPRQVSDSARLYWQAITRDLDGAVTSEQQGVISADARLLRKYDYDPVTRRLRTLDSIRSTSSSATISQRLGFEFHADGQVFRRREHIDFPVVGPVPSPRVTDEYFYGTASRLRRWTRLGAGARAEEYVYQDDGNLSEARYLSASGSVTARDAYVYSGAEGAGPHAATSIGPISYRYDKSGRQTERSIAGTVDSRRDYTAFDLPYRVQRGATPTTFKYDAFELRAQKESPTEQVTYVGDLYERRVRKGAGGTILGVSHIFYVKAEGRTVAQVTRDQTTGNEEPLFVSQDPLQSATLLVNGAGFVYQRLYYNPWGERLSPSGTVLDTNPAQPFRQGFTGHEHDDELGLVNMKGRLYDGRLRRFLSPDPLSEVPVRYPLGCVITPCDAEEAGPRSADYSVSFTRLGGDESSYQAESASEVRTAAASSGRGARNSDGMGIGLPDLALLTSRGRPAAASEPFEVPTGHNDGLNRYAYALNNPIEYRDPNGYWVETAWDIANVAVGVHSFVENVRAGNAGAAVVDGVGVVVDVVAVVAPIVPAGAAAIIRSSRAADQVADTVKAAKSASTTTKTADQAVETAQAVRKESAVEAPRQHGGEAAGEVKATTPYARPSGATTPAQRASVQGKPCVDCGKVTPKQVADHKKPLVKEHYETGSIDRTRMRSKDAVQPQCPTCSAKQGADMSRYSKEMRERVEKKE
jgi:RHS repeat-associated protein